MNETSNQEIEIDLLELLQEFKKKHCFNYWRNPFVCRGRSALCIRAYRAEIFLRAIIGLQIPKRQGQNQLCQYF